MLDVKIKGYRWISEPNMKFLHLIQWLGEVCTDTNADADANADDSDANCAQWTKHDKKNVQNLCLVISKID